MLKTEIKTKDKWYALEEERLNNAQIEPKNENWDFENLKIIQRQYNTHFFHHYTAKFIPQIPQNVIKQFRKSKNDIVFDPFLGSGTTIVEGKLLGHESYGIEISPLGFKVAKAKVTPIDFVKLDKFMRWLWESKKENNKGVKDVSLFKGSDLWFRKDVRYSIHNVLQQISDFDEDTKNFIEIGLSDHLKGISNAKMHVTVPTLPNGDTYIDKKHYYRPVNNATRKIDVYGRLFSQLNRMKNSLQFLLLKSENVSSIPIQGDSRDLCDYLCQYDVDNVNITVTSPPYWNAQNYQKLHMLSFNIFNLKEPKFAEIGRNKKDYLKDMNKVINQLSQISKGHFAFVIGEDNNGTNLHQELYNTILQNSFEHVKSIRRKLSNQAGFGKKITYEYIYIFSK